MSKICSNVIETAYENAKKHPPDYFELSGRNPNFSAKYRAKEFSHQSTLDDHYSRYAGGVGAVDKKDYINKAINFIHAPLGDDGDVFVEKESDEFGILCAWKYDYYTNIIAQFDNKGKIRTFKDLKTQPNIRTAARTNAYWEDRKGEKG